MTLLIASLFLPYSVHFQVGQSELETLNNESIEISRPNITPQPSGSLIPTLKSTPLIGSPILNKVEDIERSNTPEGFFYNRKPKKEEFHFIQPKSRVSNLKIESGIVGSKSSIDDLKLSGINRSASSNLISSTPNLSLPSLSRTKSSLTKPSGFTFHGNSSTNSLVSDDENFDQSFSDMILGKTKLAPFGGFSRPNVEAELIDDRNIFETAPWSIIDADNSNGSLIKAVNLSIEDHLIKSEKWVGVVAMPSDEVPETVKKNISQKLSDDYDCEAIFPDDITFEGHYKSFCKQILWPTFHYQIPDDPKSKAFEDHSWGHYVLLNQLIANKIVENYKEGDVVWVHDYHLLLVPNMIRKKLPQAKIGLFLHISFPSSEVFRCFAQRKEILEGMLGANCIGFQTQEYVRHFLQTCNRILLADTNEYGVSHEGNLTVTTTSPVGIDAPSVLQIVQSDTVKEWRELIKDRWKNQKLLVSRDKLDKLRGIKQKLLAYEMFLKENPEYIEKTVLIQICTSTQDQDYEAEIMKIVSRINSLPENISVTQPVVLLQRDLDFDQYLALQCEADTFIVSSMREGLNLTCHEFITATEEKKSPLLISEFTGSSAILNCKGEGALLINPWDLKKFSELIKAALTMSDEDKEKRYKNCYNVVVTRDSKHWVETCLKNIDYAWDLDHRKSEKILPFTKQKFEEFKQHKGKRLYILALEISSSAISRGGSTTVSSGKVNVIEPFRLVGLLNELMDDPDTCVYLLSYLQKSDLDIMFKRYPQIGLIAENGNYVKLIGSKEWIPIVDEEEVQLVLPEIKRLIESKVERLPGSFCEVQNSTIRFHAGSSFIEDRDRTLDSMGETIQHINTLFEHEDVHATLVRNSVVVQKNQINLKALKLIIAYYNSDVTEEYIKSHIKEFQHSTIEKIIKNEHKQIMNL
ncbi:unnamed protein product [Candida verbasci]|uniref:Uncharacterized protein n=1 Tax=Candida verbasci TaxID=1227364 RepID=A0A9W4XMA7_9ASCO|nr:unnamed protein product [Candida verbasci]